MPSIFAISSTVFVPESKSILADLAFSMAAFERPAGLPPFLPLVLAESSPVFVLSEVVYPKLLSLQRGKQH